tara:strand:- start:92 stop:307 length:216 start_codon:yes stop_codon:yes gene_type:complete
MVKLKEREFYNVATQKKEIVPEEYIRLVIFKNGGYALEAIAKDNNKMFKLVKASKIDSLERKYGKAKKYRK